MGPNEWSKLLYRRGRQPDVSASGVIVFDCPTPAAIAVGDKNARGHEEEGRGDERF